MAERWQQPQGLRITVIDPDDDYVGIEIYAANQRFAGTTKIYAGLDDLSQFANKISGFPANVQDERTYKFGSPGPSVAGGYCKLSFRCADKLGHVSISIVIEDDHHRYPQGRAELNVKAEPAELDRFIKKVQETELKQSGEAFLITNG